MGINIGTVLGGGAGYLLGGGVGAGLGAILGGSMSGSGGQSTQTVQNYSPEEAARRAQVMAEAERIFKAMSAGGTPAFPGAAPVGPSQATLNAQGRLQGFSTGAGQNAANQALGALQFGLGDVLYPQSNPALQATIDTATRHIGNQFTDPGGVLSQIRNEFSGSSSDGVSSREGIAGGMAARSYLDAVGDVTGKITSEGYKAGLDTFGRTMAFAPNLYNMGTQPAITEGAVGQQQEAYAQAQQDFEAASRMWDINAPWNNVQNYANIVFGGSSPGSTTTSTNQISSVQRAGMALSGAAMGFQMGGPYGAAAGAALGLLLGR